MLQWIDGAKCPLKNIFELVESIVAIGAMLRLFSSQFQHPRGLKKYATMAKMSPNVILSLANSGPTKDHYWFICFQ